MTKSFIFDSNTLISGFMFRNSTPRVAYNKAVKSGILSASIETFLEFKSTFLKPKFDKYISPQDRLLVFDELEEILEFSIVEDRIAACHDPKDDKYLDLAVTVSADCIVTGDKDSYPVRLISTDFCDEKYLISSSSSLAIAKAMSVFAFSI